jgi:hypothetical protein
VVELRPAELQLRAVGQHDLEPADVIRREAVLEAVRPAGVLRDVAPDRADDLARGVWREEVRRRDRLRHRDVGHARLDENAAIGDVHLEDAAKPRQPDQHALLDRQRAAGEAGPGAARDPRHLLLVAGAHDPGDLVRRARQHDGHRARRVLEQPVRLIGRELPLVRDEVLAPDYASQPCQERAIRH